MTMLLYKEDAIWEGGSALCSCFISWNRWPFMLTSRNYLLFFDVFLNVYCLLNKEYVLETTIIKIKGIAREIIWKWKKVDISMIYQMI